MNTSTNTKLIGHCAVDSGQILLVDPCYIKSDGPDKWTENWSPGDVDPKGYGACCEASLSDDGAGEVLVCGVGGTAVCTSSGYGDGNYPVYAEYNSDGRIARVTIEFDAPIDEDDEDEDY